MKTLLILRHAKSSWKERGLPDHKRPLNKRGKKDAPRMGRLLKKRRLLPEYIVCSDAKRAMSTAKKVIKESGFKGRCLFTKTLYETEGDSYISALKKIKKDHRSVMVIGHNPALEELFESLSGKYEKLPTAALAVLELKIKKWPDLKPGVGCKVKKIWRPKELP